MSKTINSLSIIIPCFNEEATLQELLEKVHSVDTSPLSKEIIVVNDGSTDKSQNIIDQSTIIHKKIHNDTNIGKGGSIKKALEFATGDLILIQDADLEYCPDDYPALIAPILEGSTNIVYGARKTKHLNKPSWSFAARILFTTILNFLYQSKLTDLNTCYKLFKRDILISCQLESKRFGFCSEATAKALLMKEKILEVEVDYHPRYKAEGKKISPLDGFPILFNLFYYRFIKRPVIQEQVNEA